MAKDLNLIVEQLLKTKERYLADDGKILKPVLHADVSAMNLELIQMLANNQDTKKAFFVELDGLLVFDKQKFSWFIENKEFLPDSYTKYTNKIGLKNGDRFISSTNDVELAFPYKDCVLTGGQTKEDQKRDEIFFNEIISSDEITRLLEPKVFTNVKRIYNKKTIEGIDSFEEGNLIIKGNNLITISSLLKRYESRIKLIYIDPPYNTAGDYNTFCYNNTFNHSSWLTFMKNRLDVSYRLLDDDGVICIAIDDYEYAHLKVMCDEIFGRENYVGTIVVQSNPSGTTSNSYFAKCHEYCLFYAKNIENVVVKSFDLTPEQAKQYKYQDDESFYKWRDFMRTGGTSTPDVRPNSYYPIYYYPNENKLSLENGDGAIEVYPYDSSGKARVWRQTRPSFLELNKKGELMCTCKNGKYSIRIKDRIKDGMKPKTIWADPIYSATTYGTELLKKFFGGEKVFSYPKSIYTVKHIIRMIGDTDDIVLDFFGGSGTTGQAVLELNKEDGGNRKFIICEQMDYIEPVTVERVRQCLSDNESFLYFELKENSKKLIDEVLSANENNIDEIGKKIFDDDRIVSYITKDDIHNAENLFADMDLEGKRKALVGIIDKNKLYVNYSDIEDSSYSISEQDKGFTKSFYSR